MSRYIKKEKICEYTPALSLLQSLADMACYYNVIPCYITSGGLLSRPVITICSLSRPVITMLYHVISPLESD